MCVCRAARHGCGSRPTHVNMLIYINDKHRFAPYFGLQVVINLSDHGGEPGGAEVFCKRKSGCMDALNKQIRRKGPACLPRLPIPIR